MFPAPRQKRKALRSGNIFAGEVSFRAHRYRNNVERAGLKYGKQNGIIRSEPFRFASINRHADNSCINAGRVLYFDLILSPTENPVHLESLPFLRNAGT